MRFTWCMGGITFLMFLVTVVTGVYLMFYYRPTAEYAYADMKYLEFDMPFGMFMRNMHRWAAHGMVIAVWLHMFRVFLTGSYKPPREFNWVVGVILLVLTLLLSFTGYLLPWDQLSIWAVTVGSNMARATPLLGTRGRSPQYVGVNPIYDARAFLFGGGEIGPHTLLRFYILHCIFIPARRQPVHGGALLAHPARRLLRSAGVSGGAGQYVHVAGATQVRHRQRSSWWCSSDGAFRPLRVLVLPVIFVCLIVVLLLGRASRGRRSSRWPSCRSRPVAPPAGGRARRGPDRARRVGPVDDKIHTWPHLVRAEFLCAHLMIVLLIVWSLLVDAPLEEPANPTRTPNPSKAPWYFLGLQEMLVFFDPWHAGVVLPELHHRRPDGHPVHRHQSARERLLLLRRAQVRDPHLLPRLPHPVGVADHHRHVPARAGLELVLAVAGVGPAQGRGDDQRRPAVPVRLPRLSVVVDRSAARVVVGYFVVGTVGMYCRHRALQGAASSWRAGACRGFITTSFLFLNMLAVVIKMVMRHALNIKYVWVTPWLNI